MANIRITTLACAAVVAAALAGQAQTSESVLYSFQPDPPDGSFPYAGVIRDAAGNLYGTTAQGGPTGKGVVYKLDTNGSVIVLHGFGTGLDGAAPNAGVVLDSAGNLYGTTRNGGSAGTGVVYKLDSTGHETVLYSFTGGADGGYPVAGVILDSAGNLYGTTPLGGATGYGAVYELTPAGTETVLYSFQGLADGSYPTAGVIRDAAGNLYGTTSTGGAGYGVVYKLGPAGSETVLYSFHGLADGSQPLTGVIRDAAGNLYGTTFYGGSARVGVIYKLDPVGNETVLYSFPGGLSGHGPTSGLLRDSAGNLYGTAGGGVDDGGVVYVLHADGNETVLHFFGGPPDGLYPYGSLIQDSAGNLYGTTVRGGELTNVCTDIGCGVVYELSPAGQETLLYTFPVGTDGSLPAAPVVLDGTGNLYGTTSEGGGLINVGTVYKINPAGQESILHTFTFGSDGAAPSAGLALDSMGNLYGTTGAGGNDVCTGLSGCGVVFEIGADGGMSTLYAFSGPDGAGPSSGVTLDAAGNLYGTTFHGGATTSCPSAAGTGCGVVYKLDAASKETVLYSFTGGTDGGNPSGGVILDPAGNIYGSTFYGGTGACQKVGAEGCGVIFKLNPAGQETVLYSFSGAGDGANPNDVILDANGNLYGTTYSGGIFTGNCSSTDGCGVVFKLDASGTLTVLHSFTGGKDGGLPEAGVVLDASGNLYGTTYGGGSARGGVVYKITPSGEETVLMNFTGPNGYRSTAPLVLDSSGNLYGTAVGGGKQNAGVVFRLAAH